MTYEEGYMLEDAFFAGEKEAYEEAMSMLHPKMGDEIKFDPELEPIRVKALQERIERTRKRYFDGCMQHAQNDYGKFQGLMMIESLQALERELMSMYREGKMLLGKREGFAPEQIARAREFPISEFVKTFRGMAKCPFHNDKRPSMDVRKNFYFCYGCGATGDVIDYVMKTEGLTFKRAVERLI